MRVNSDEKSENMHFCKVLPKISPKTNNLMEQQKKLILLPLNPNAYPEPYTVNPKP